MRAEEQTFPNAEQNGREYDRSPGEVPGETAPEAAESVAELNERLQLAREESQKNYDLFLRAVAETENLRKRSQREREEYLKFASLPLIKELLTIIDDLERALVMAGPEQDYANLYKGVAMVHQRLQEIIARAGVEPVEALGQCFDPQYHQPLSVESCEGHPENIVIEELQKGYVMHGRLIRPSLVKVSG
ncbi:MAG: nucleotide exchange factor GrpE [Syntrophomonadaceae bacterium]|jgi:molecular chaperone GrpE